MSDCPAQDGSAAQPIDPVAEVKVERSPEPTPAIPHSTPISRGSRSYEPHAFTHRTHHKPYFAIEEEMGSRYREYAVDKFLNLLPVANRPMPRVTANHYAALTKVTEKKNETEMYDPFIKAMNPFLAKPWAFKNTSRHRIPWAVPAYDRSEISPDLTMYPYARNSTFDDDVVTDPSTAELMTEFKIHSFDEPFRVLSQEQLDALPDGHAAKELPLEVDTDAARHTRGQIAAQINSIQWSQQRTGTFHIFVLRQHCRLMYHTRAGTLVTPQFDYTKAPYLHKFLWRLSHASPVQRGHDKTFQLIRNIKNPRERLSRKAAIKNSTPALTKAEKEEIENARDQLDLKDDTTPLYKVSIGSQFRTNTAPDYVYVSTPMTQTHRFIVGRSTRCFKAYDPVNKRLVLLKDTWRVEEYGVEHETYAELHAANVPHIAGIVAAGDVIEDSNEEHASGSDEEHGSGSAEVRASGSDEEHASGSEDSQDSYMEDSGSEDSQDSYMEDSCSEHCSQDGDEEDLSNRHKTPRVRGRALHHYRIVLDCLGEPIFMFKHSRELVSCVADAFEAHKVAYEVAKILHRDVSVGNILIVVDSSGNRHGMLIDWERAKKVNGPQDMRDFDRTGTWQFMSIKLLQTPHNVLHTVEDDIESFIYVVIWIVAKHTKTDMSDEDFVEVLEAFDYRINNPGRARLRMLKSVLSELSIVSKPFNALFKDIIGTFLPSVVDFSQWCKHDDHRLFAARRLVADDVGDNGTGARVNVATPRSSTDTPAPILEMADAAKTSQLEDHLKRAYDAARLTMQSHAWMLDTMRTSVASPDWKGDDPAIHRVLPVVEPDPMIDISKKRLAAMGASQDSAKKSRHE